MGKKQHQKDKLYLTKTEWSTLYGGKKAAQGDNSGEFRRLPFDCCSISLLPFTHPYCTREGVIFDLQNVLPFIKKFGINPVNGEKITVKDLIKLNFYKNSSNKYHCPITYKVFNQNTIIVCITTTGNVYAFEAVERLNLKPNVLKDLVDGTPFSRKDILTLQDPNSLQKFNISQFYHVQLNIMEKGEEKESNLKLAAVETKEVLSELNRSKTIHQSFSTEKSADPKTLPTIKDEFNMANYSTGAVAASLTCTVMPAVCSVEPALLGDDEVRYSRVKSKAFVRINTNFGPLNFELHCDLVPKTCENFILLSKRGYYDETKFHRLIRYFILQGGDPTGTGRGGKSANDDYFADEFHKKLLHDSRGVLSMANSGKDTNGSQFFITLRSAKQLNNKHTVFGKLVGGEKTLLEIEKIETDKDDRPLERIVLQSVEVFVDPFEAADKQLEEERAALASKKRRAEEAQIKPGNRAEEEKLLEQRRLMLPDPSDSAEDQLLPRLRQYRSGVGKFLRLDSQDKRPESTATVSETQLKRQRHQAATAGNAAHFGDFSTWT